MRNDIFKIIHFVTVYGGKKIGKKKPQMCSNMGLVTEIMYIYQVEYCVAGSDRVLSIHYFLKKARWRTVSTVGYHLCQKDSKNICFCVLV